MSKILITGGAGYIGSHVVNSLQATKHQLVVLDNLSTGFKENVETVTFYQGDINDVPLVNHIIHTESIDTIMHFAALTAIPDSIKDPLKYYANNTLGTFHLLQAALKNKVRHFIFSSTAAVYGQNASNKITENHALVPTNPYGYSKLMSEQLIKDTAATSKLKFVILRYFNVAGACPSGNFGQRHKNATHLIKVVMETACGLRSALPIYGMDYPTKDGTCIRDFIHVNDIANAHVKALEYLESGNASLTVNCGYGKGVSIKEVIATTEQVTGRTIPFFHAPRRPGDLPCVIADNTLIQHTLNWHPQFADLQLIIQTAYDFEKNLASA